MLHALFSVLLMGCSSDRLELDFARKKNGQYPANLGDVQSLRLAIEKSLFNKDPRSKWIPIPWEGVHKT